MSRLGRARPINWWLKHNLENKLPGFWPTGVPESDSGTSAESLSISATVVLSDSGVASDSISSAFAKSSTDSGSSSESVGVTIYKDFPLNPLGLKYEILLNGTWTDITDFVYQRADTTISCGMPNETTTATPGSMTLTLNNRDGRFSPKNTLGAFYPYLTRNTQFRTSVMAGSPNGDSIYPAVGQIGYRYWGEVSNWPPKWDPSGTDVYCDIVVSGPLRRYVQGAKIGSPLERYYTRLSGIYVPVAAWPCEDSSSATQFASLLSGGNAMTWTGNPTLSSDTSLVGSDPLPLISSSKWHGQTGAPANPSGTGSIDQTIPGVYTWTCPPGVTSVNVTKCVGGGGSGAAASASSPGGGGGGGAEESADNSVAVTANNTYTYVVPSGGSSGGDGENATWTGDSTVVIAHGGKGGNPAGTGGLAGTGSTNATHHDGGSGASGSSSSTQNFSKSYYGSAGSNGGGENGGQSTNSFTLPANSTLTDAIVTGAGGGGQWDGSTNYYGFAGGVGSFSPAMSPGDTVSLAAGNGGGESYTGQGGQGGSSFFGSNSEPGGTGGSTSSNNGTSGAPNNGIGQPGSVLVAWTQTVPSVAGGGGTSAGTAASGNAGSASGGSTTAPTGGGDGGAAEMPGSSPGGGGGGAVQGAMPGNGASGEVAFSWNGGVTSPIAGNIVRCYIRIDPSGETDGLELLRILTYQTVATLKLFYHTGGKLELIGYDSSSTQLFDSGSQSFGADGVGLFVDIELTQSGTSVNWKLSAIEPGAGSVVGTYTGTLTSSSVGNVSDVYVNFNSSTTKSATSAGWIVVATYADTLVNTSVVLAGYNGERAAARMSRLCAEQGLGFELVGNTSDTPQMGPQQDDTFVNVLQSCMDVDKGILYETRDQFGLGFRTRVSLQNQTPLLLKYTDGLLAQQLQPVADDQQTRNDITVTRQGGSSVHVALTSGVMSTQSPPNGVGDYTYSPTIRLYADSQLANYAQWLLDLGTVDEYRYPQVAFDLSRKETSVVFAKLADLRLGDYIQLYQLPQFLTLNPVSQLAWGYTEVLNAYRWTLSFNCVPESPYDGASLPSW